jgi:hypothetical protein
MTDRSCLVAIVLALSCVSVAQQTTAQTPLDSEEYKVMASAIDGYRQARVASHPVVADRTSTFECASVCNGIVIGECNGLRDKDEAPADRLAIVKRDLPELEETTLSDFKLKNQHCSEIEKQISTESPYFLLGADHAEKLPSGWEHADFFYFSRVAFNAQQTQALVHISFMSGTNADDSGGKYFLFKKQAGKWVANGSSIVWQLVSH